MTGINTNSIIAPASKTLSGLQYIRVTSLKDFDECPDRWRAKYMEGVKEADSKAANVGTAVHSIAEMHIKAKHDDTFVLDEDEFRRNYMIVPANEADRMMEYMGTLSDEPMHAIGVELKFEIEVVPGMPIIRGHIDLLLQDDEGNVTIVDHKTNRSANDETWWASQLQPQLYSLAVETLFKPRSINYRIGYVNLGYNVEWSVTRQDNARTVRRIAELWEKMQECSLEYERDAAHMPGAHWPRNVTQGCQWCPIKSRCSDYNESMNNFARSFEAKRAATLSERLEFAQTVEKLACAEKELLQATIKARVLSDPTDEFHDGDVSWKIVQKQQRSVKPSHLLGVLGAMLNDNVLPVETYKNNLDIIFSVKVTGLDKMSKTVDGLKEVIESITAMKPVGDGTLTMVKNERRIAGTQGIGALDSMMNKKDEDK